MFFFLSFFLSLFFYLLLFRKKIPLSFSQPPPSPPPTNSELDAGMSSRFRLLKKQLLLSLSAPYRNEMLAQAGLVRQLNSIAKQVKEINQKDKRQELLHQHLQKVCLKRGTERQKERERGEIKKKKKAPIPNIFP